VQDSSVLLKLPAKPLLASPPVGTTNYYRPLVVVLYNVMWHAGGGRPLAFHLLNVVFHMLNATLLLLLIRRLPGAGDAAALGAALLFAVHPANVEVVAWPSCLPELGYAAFGLAALIVYVRSWSRAAGAARKDRAVSIALFFLACACKETALAFLPLIVLLSFWLRPEGAKSTRPRWQAALSDALPYLGVAALYLTARTAVLGGLVAAGAHSSRTLSDAVLNAPWLSLLYVKSMLVPAPLLVEHVVPLVSSMADPKFLGGAVVAAAAIVAIVRLRRVRPDLAFAACLIVFTLLPALYLPALGRDPFAERYAYLGVAGASWLVAGGLVALLGGRFTTPRWSYAALIGVLVVAGATRSFARCTEWRDDETLGRASMRDEPRAAIGYLLLGNHQLRAGRKDDALQTFTEGASHAPESVDLQQNALALGAELGKTTPDDAIAAYGRLASTAPGNASVPYNLGQVLLQAGRRDEAKAAFLHALDLAPTSVRSLTALAVIASQENDPAGAADYCRRALAIDDRATPALQQLGVALMRQGDVAGAVNALERAVALDPADKESLNRLGVGYARSGRSDDARRAWERALAIDPQFTGARQNLERLRQMGR
jgi:Flp pilus assembly protein TadD